MTKKLVRSKIKDLIEEEGKSSDSIDIIPHDVNSNKELIRLFKEKLFEESNEVLESKNRAELLEELADVEQVLCELKRLIKVSDDSMNSLKESKKIRAGEFMRCNAKDGNKYYYVMDLDKFSEDMEEEKE